METALPGRRALVDPKFFKSIDFTVTLDNSITRMKTTSKSRPKAELFEVDGEELVLDAPGKLCALGHSVYLTIVATNCVKPLAFSSTARVTWIDHQPDGRDRLRVELVQYDKKTWEELCGIFRERQREIHEFMSEAKGY